MIFILFCVLSAETIIWESHFTHVHNEEESKEGEFDSSEYVRITFGHYINTDEQRITHIKRIYDTGS